MTPHDPVSASLGDAVTAQEDRLLRLGNGTELPVCMDGCGAIVWYPPAHVCPPDPPIKYALCRLCGYEKELGIR